MEISDVENTKSPALRFIMGLLLGTTITYLAIDNIYKERFNAFDEILRLKEVQISDYKRKLVRAEKEINTQGKKSLVKIAESVQELKNYISGLDVELDIKERELMMMKRINEFNSGTPGGYQKTDAYERLITEIKELQSHKIKARNKMLNLISK